MKYTRKDERERAAKPYHARPEHLPRQACRAEAALPSVPTLLELLASKMTPQEILQDYPDLEMEDLQAVLMYVARLSEVKWVSSFMR